MSQQEVEQSSGVGQEPPAAPRQLAGPVFGPNFYASVLADRIVSECQGDPSGVPVVNLHLANGRTLDLCHITYLSERWFGVQYFRDSKTCTDMDLAFLPYDLVVLVTVSVHHSEERRMGFNIGNSPSSTSGQPAEPS